MRTQYRVTIENNVPKIYDSLSDCNWGRVAEIAEERGVNAKLESRSIYPATDYDLLFLQCLGGDYEKPPEGWVIFPNKTLVSFWFYEASIVQHD